MSNFQPRKTDPRWAALPYLFYTGFIFLQPVMSHSDWRVWSESIVAVLIFLVLYLTYSWRKGPIKLWCVAGIAALGFLCWPSNFGTSAFFIYAAALLGFVFEPTSAFVWIGILVAGIGLEGWFLHLAVWFWAPAMLMTLAIGSINVHAGAEKRANVKLQLAQEEIERLAKVAERERIARDLHDVLGHTLSVIVLKSELATRLLDRDAERARTEIFEVQQIAREALAEVRHAIRGYRAGSLTEEFARARSTLETAGIRTECETPQAGAASGELSPAQETVLALVVREAVTNVVRHSQARVCKLRLERKRDTYLLEIEDDGRGGSQEEGNGLRGMRERIEALSGAMMRDTSHGTRLTATIPVRSKQEATA